MARIVTIRIDLDDEEDALLSQAFDAEYGGSAPAFDAAFSENFLLGLREAVRGFVLARQDIGFYDMPTATSVATPPLP